MGKYPDSVTHDQMLEAMQPLLDLCGTTANEIFFGFQVREGDSSNPEEIELARIEFVSAVDPQDGTEPVTVGEGEFAVQGWPVSIVVL